ncbi:MAG: hypothetical protein AUI08_02275 [Gemmatimonadetes bacterium 13_2_20CM_2_65_7]|nr:MAG: hypothetical protein AUI08_02275 [Gemmatimonadetes bacterium 13_2_20CM_2_65_7]
MPRTPPICLVLLAVAPPASLIAQNIHPTPPPEVRAVPLHEAVHLDGKLDEVVWHTAPAATGLRQAQPHEGEVATQRTEVRFAFDGAALYVGARMFDDSGARGVRTRLVRRDADMNSDYLEVIFDTYHDHIGRLFFQVNPSGVKMDANGLGGGSDNSWDPVWEVKTAIDSLGWTAEMRIPFSQLRFSSTTAEQTWGLQIWRQENRLNELSQWAFWKLNETGGPSKFGHLHGLVITTAPERAELLPYVVGRSSNVPGNTANPFYDPHALDGRVGMDARVLLTSNLTLNATVNPDFGQVEVDPAVVNLTDFETFLSERRPFFVEGAGYFGLGGLNCFFCSNVSSLAMLSTRRIGRAPQLSAYRDTLDQYVDRPQNTTILGAAKLTGRTPSGWSIGALDAVTRRERALVQRLDSTRVGYTVEPLTNYFVSRVAKDLAGGATQIKVMGTSVYRSLGDSFAVSNLTRSADALGVGTEIWWGKHTYHLMAQAAGTELIGDTAAIHKVQVSPRHYFQRPDRSHPLDPTRTSLTGLGAYTRVAREEGSLLWELSGNVRTPGFDNNDMTFFSRGDYIWMSGNILRQWTTPTKGYRQLLFILGGQQQYNFDGDLTDREVHWYGQITTLNYWGVSTFWIHRANVFDDRLTRGGPVVRSAGSEDWFVNVNTDSRKKVVLGSNGDISCDREGYCYRSFNLQVQLRPASNIQLTVGPSLSHQETGAQYVQTVPDTFAKSFYGNHYVFAQLIQNAIVMQTRFNVTLSPVLTLELYLQPLIASGAYSQYREFAGPRQLRKLVYGVDVGTDSVPAGSPQQHWIDPDGPTGPAPKFLINDPSFTFRSLRGNAVLRWEYRPGSTLFVVWTRNGSSDVTRGQIDFGTDAGALLRGPSANVFLVKMNYWLGF